MGMQHPEICLFFLTIAMVYASVGFGGGSSYLAILAVYGLPFAEIKFTALLCNVIVVTGGTILFIRKGQIDWRKVLPLVILSVPMAFLGAMIKLNQETFFIILGFSLLLASVLLWLKTGADEERLANESISNTQNGLVGGAIGFLSGMVGIGGGIFLSPYLNLTKWDTARKIAAAASVFILINSLSGIAGQLTNTTDNINYANIIWLSLSVLIGGQIGSRIAIAKFNLLWIRRITAVLVLIAGIEILSKHFHF